MKSDERDEVEIEDVPRSCARSRATADRYGHLLKNQSSHAGDRIGAARGERAKPKRKTRKPF